MIVILGRNSVQEQILGGYRNNSSMQSMSESKLMPIKSLHYLQKKKEFDRIEKENIKMMDRICHQGSTISLKKLQADYINK